MIDEQRAPVSTRLDAPASGRAPAGEAANGWDAGPADARSARRPRARVEALVRQPGADALVVDSNEWPALDPAAVEAALALIHARGDRFMAVLVGLHAVLALALAPAYDTWRATLLVTPLAAGAFYLAWSLAPGRFVTRVTAGVVLQTFCALHIHQLSGLAEMHFFYFTSVTAMILYQDWRAVWPGIVAIVAQHTLFSVWHNAGVHPGGQAFFEPAVVGPSKLAWHYGIAIGQSALASWAAHGLRARTLHGAAQRAALHAQARHLADVNARLEAQALALQEQTVELEAVNDQLQDQQTELEAQADALAEQSALAEAARAALQATLERLGDAFVAVDRAWRVTYANTPAAPLLGRPAGEVVGRVLWDVLPPAVAATLRPALAGAMDDSVPVRLEARLEPGDACLAVAAHPGPDGLSIFAEDVTERRAIEARLRASEERFRVVQAASPDGFMLFTSVRDATGRIVDFAWVYANPAAERVVGRTHAELLGRRLLEEMPGNRADGLFDQYVAVVETGEPARREFHYTHEGLDHWFANVAVRVGDGFGVTFTDVTARRRAELARDAALAEAQVARDAAHAANQAKSQFLAAMSHELRTPLNAITGYADLLALGVRGPITAAQADDVARIKRSGQHLLVLINDILHFAKLEAGQVEYRVEPVPVEALLDEVEPLVAPQMAARALAYAVAPAPGLVARGDRDKVRQVLVNLLTNACKFTAPGGRVTVTARPVELDADDPAADGAAGAGVAIDVADTGVGIAPEAHAAIFEPFVQLDREAVRDSRLGVGLGLAISRDLARAMGGDLTVRSAPGAGSTFTLVLPAEPAPTTALSTALSSAPVPSPSASE